MMFLCTAAFALIVVASKAFSTQPHRTFLVTGASGYVGREIVHALIIDDDTKDDAIVCLVRPSRVEDEQLYWQERSTSVSVLPYDMLDGGATLQDALGSCQGIRCLLHVASVFGPTENHKETALDNVRGTEDLVRTCAKFSGTRLVLTSSTAAVRGTGQSPLNDKFYTHKDWNTLSELGKNWGNSYQWSKAESERRAWELARELGVPMVSLCPAFIFGPSTDGQLTSNSYSITLVSQWIRGESEVQSRLCVDVRDVAKAHVRASVLESAIGKRYIVSAERRLPSEVTANALKEASPNPENITYDAEFDGGAIKIGEKEVEGVDRLAKELGVSLRPVDVTFRDMARILTQTPLDVK